VDAHAGFDGIDVNIASLETVLTGAVAFATPGAHGRKAKNGQEYALFDNRVAALKSHADSLGLHVNLLTHRLGSVADGDPILYRGVEVGRILGHELEEGSRRVILHLQIDSHYAPLVRRNSVFWNASGIDSDFGLTGLHVHVASLKSLLEGAIAFATPDPPGAEAEPGTRFELASKRKDKWMKWSPDLPLEPEPSGNQSD
jgi:paraquat-inducible protein B